MKRPWNLPDLPVYSLATYGSEKLNMNLCTYVSAVSMTPKRYIVAVYRGTQSLANMTRSKQAVLQMLGKNHISLVNVLGKKTGFHYNKELYLSRKGLLGVWHNKPVLTNCAALMEIEKVWSKNAGDHVLFLFDVKRAISNHENILTVAGLRAKKLIRI
jgi:flavin reductase (DIM6/NTAB) family NADH-FMN oxidoreductase RutF